MEVACQVLFDLAFCLGKKAQADGIPQAPGQQPDAECSGVPQRVQYAWPRSKLIQTLHRPCEVIILLARGLIEMSLQHRIARAQPLRLIERLSADLADMVHPHERTGVLPFGFGKCIGGSDSFGSRTSSAARPADGSECVVGGNE